MPKKRQQDDDRPEHRAQKDHQKSVKDAHCTECGEWYDSSNNAQVRRHAH